MQHNLAHQNILKSALVVDCLVVLAAGLSQVVIAVRMCQPERLCRHTETHKNTQITTSMTHLNHVSFLLFLCLKSVCTDS